MARKFFVEGPNKGREFIRGARIPEDTGSIERRNFLKRRQNSMLRGARIVVPEMQRLQGVSRS